MKDIACPVCHTLNTVQTSLCLKCGCILQQYIRLSSYPAQLFNSALAEIQKGQIDHAQELFASIVHWCPSDIEARNALALTYFTQNNHAMALHHWNSVLAQAPQNDIALQGIAKLVNLKSIQTHGKMYQRTKKENLNEVSKQCCPNKMCSANGKIGLGNIISYGRRHKKFKCKTCGRMFYLNSAKLQKQKKTLSDH